MGELNIWEKYREKYMIYSINTPKRNAMFMANVEYESKNPIHGKYDGKYGVIKSLYLKLRYSRLFRSLFKVSISDVNNSLDFRYNNLGMLKLDREFFKDYVSHLLKLEESDISEYNATQASLIYWNQKYLNSFADKNDIVGCTIAITGCLRGLESRAELYTKWLKFFETPNTL